MHRKATRSCVGLRPGLFSSLRPGLCSGLLSLCALGRALVGEDGCGGGGGATGLDVYCVGEDGCGGGGGATGLDVCCVGPCLPWWRYERSICASWE